MKSRLAIIILAAFSTLCVNSAFCEKSAAEGKTDQRTINRMERLQSRISTLEAERSAEGKTPEEVAALDTRIAEFKKRLAGLESGSTAEGTTESTPS